jgi:hypothetical protein
MPWAQCLAQSARQAILSEDNDDDLCGKDDEET